MKHLRGKLRGELLNRKQFLSLQEAGSVVDRWRREYSTADLHSTLANLTPRDFASSCQAYLTI